MPTVQGTDDFTGAVTVPPYEAVFGAPTTVTSPVYPNGGVKTLSIVTTGGNIGVQRPITGTPARSWVGFSFRITSDWKDAQIFMAEATAGNGSRLALNSSHQLYGFFTGGGATSLGPVLTLDTWYWIETITNYNPTTRTCVWQVNGVDQTSFTKSGETASTGANSKMISFSGDPSGGTLYYGLWKWGSATSDTDWLGEPAAATAVTGALSGMAAMGF